MKVLARDTTICKFRKWENHHQTDGKVASLSGELCAKFSLYTQPNGWRKDVIEESYLRVEELMSLIHLLSPQGPKIGFYGYEEIAKALNKYPLDQRSLKLPSSGDEAKKSLLER